MGADATWLVYNYVYISHNQNTIYDMWRIGIFIIEISRWLESYPIPGEYLEHYTPGNIRADLSPYRWSLDLYQWL